MEVSGIITIHKIIRKKSKERNESIITEGKINIGKLENIVEKPNLVLFGQNSKYDTPIKKSACLIEGIIRLHLFTDGNKRTALYTAFAYLQREGIKLDLNLISAYFLVYIASIKSKDEEEIDMLIDEIEFYLSQRIKK